MRLNEKTTQNYLSFLEYAYVNSEDFTFTNSCLAYSVSGSTRKAMTQLKLIQQVKRGTYKYIGPTPNMELAKRVHSTCNKLQNIKDKNNIDAQIKEVESGKNPQLFTETANSITEEQAIQVLKSSTKYEYEIFRIEKVKKQL